MITFIRSFGNHTNQIWEFVTSDALAKELNTNFRFLFIKNFFRYYPNISKKYKNFSTLFIYPCLSFIFRLLRKLKSINFLCLTDSSSCKLLASNPSHNQYILPFCDYEVNKTLYNNQDLLLKYHDYYKNLFTTDISEAKEKYIARIMFNL